MEAKHCNEGWGLERKERGGEGIIGKYALNKA